MPLLTPYRIICIAKFTNCIANGDRDDAKDLRQDARPAIWTRDKDNRMEKLDLQTHICHAMLDWLRRARRVSGSHADYRGEGNICVSQRRQRHPEAV